MKAINVINNIVKAIKNHNKIYTLVFGWAFYLYLLAEKTNNIGFLIGFIIGFILFGIFTLLILHKPNKKELASLNKALETISK